MRTSGHESAGNAGIPNASSPYASDLEMAYRLARTDAGAVEEFCEAYTARVRLYVSARFADATSAEHDDLTQIIMIASIKGIKHYRGNSSLLTWLLSISRNKVADALKARVRKRLHEVSLSEIADSDSEGEEWDLPDLTAENEPETAATLNDLKGQIRKALRLLKAEHQEILILRYIQDLQVAEVAEVLGLNKRNAEYRLTEARTAFRRTLAQLGLSKSDT